MRTKQLLFVISTLGIGCSGSSSLGNDRGTSNGGTGGSAAGTGGSVVTAGMSSGATGGSKADSGSGGSSSGAGGPGSGGAAQTGTGGSGASAGTTGGAATTGGTGGSSGSGVGATSGDAGADPGQGGEGPILVYEPKVTVDDPETPGAGPCSMLTVNEVLDAIHAEHPELSDISLLYRPDLFGQSNVVYAFTSPGGYSLALAAGEGDCPAGCINWEYWYFETDASCVPQQVGHYSAMYGPGNCYTVVGEPMWDVPDHTPASQCAP